MDSPEGSRPQMPEMPNPSDSSTHAEGIIQYKLYDRFYKGEIDSDALRGQLATLRHRLGESRKDQILDGRATNPRWEDEMRDLTWREEMRARETRKWGGILGNKADVPPFPDSITPEQIEGLTRLGLQLVGVPTLHYAGHLIQGQYVMSVLNKMYPQLNSPNPRINTKALERAVPLAIRELKTNTEAFLPFPSGGWMMVEDAQLQPYLSLNPEEILYSDSGLRLPQERTTMTPEEIQVALLATQMRLIAEYGLPPNITVGLPPITHYGLLFGGKNPLIDIRNRQPACPEWSHEGISLAPDPENSDANKTWTESIRFGRPLPPIGWRAVVTLPR